MNHLYVSMNTDQHIDCINAVFCM